MVKGKGFNSWRSVGHAVQAVRVHQNRFVDELFVLDISATDKGKGPDLKLVESFAEECFMPLTIGGGIRNIEDVARLIRQGADKVCIGTAAFNNPALIKEAADKFGSQAIVISIDVGLDDYVYVNSGKVKTHWRPQDYALELERMGAGEILLNSIPREGTLSGYDLINIKVVNEAVAIPVVACGGAGTYEHMAEALRYGAHAVAAGAMFQFTDATPQGAAEWLSKQGFAMRVTA